MLVASIQMTTVEYDKIATIEKAEENIRRAAGADLIILPELWNIGFMSFDRYRSEAEHRDGPTISRMQALAKETNAFLYTGSFVEVDAGQYFNSSYLISPVGEILANYRKIHLFGYSSKEPEILSHGDQIVVAKTPLGNFGLATCYDLRFPELFRRMLEKNAEVFLICSAWPYPRLEDWIMLNRVRALENQGFLISANAVGMNRGIQFAGHSMIINPWGIILASAGDDEVILTTVVNTREVADARKRFPAVSDRLEWVSKRA
jgi:predicted amidohydrolase